MDYLNFFRELNKRGIDYLVVGGMAVNFHGIPRMTYDIDIMIMLEKDNIKLLTDFLIYAGYKPRVNEDPLGLADKEKRRVWIKHKGMNAFTFWSDTNVIKEIDVVFASDIPYEDLKKRAKYISIKDVLVPIISLRDLIKIKEKSSRVQDMSDVEHLKRLLEYKNEK